MLQFPHVSERLLALSRSAKSPLKRYDITDARFAMIKEYLVDNFQLSPSNLRAIGYGKTRPKNKMDPNAPENRRVEVVNETARAKAQR
jgi:hypothetical protein